MRESCLAPSATDRIAKALEAVAAGYVDAFDHLSSDEKDELSLALMEFTAADYNPIGDLEEEFDSSSNEEMPVEANPKKKSVSKKDLFRELGDEFTLPTGERIKTKGIPFSRSFWPEHVAAIWHERAKKVLEAGGDPASVITPESMGMHRRNILNMNTKMDKSTGFGFFAPGLSLAPHKMAGVMNTCSHASLGCRSACLVSSGRAEMESNKVIGAIREGRVRRTLLYFYNKVAFGNLLYDAILYVIEQANQARLRPALRLNVLSDLMWEVGTPSGRRVIQDHPDIQFYDYTKIPVRMGNFLSKSKGMPSQWPENYYLTFSFSEANLPYVLKILEQGGNVAVPFDDSMGYSTDQPGWSESRVAKAILPHQWYSYPVIDGDLYDARFYDRTYFDLHKDAGFVVGLRVKGNKQKRAARESFDPYGFVQHSVWAEQGEYDRRLDEMVAVADKRAQEQQTHGFFRGKLPGAS